MRLPKDHSNSLSNVTAYVALLGMMLVFLGGCYRPYYYAPPMQTYQGPVAPIQTLTPGPSYVPGQVAPGGLQPIPADQSLGSGSSQPFYGSGSNGSSTTPQPTFDNSGDPGVYNPQPNNGGGSNAVPNYNDPVDDFLTPEISPGSGTIDEFKIPTTEPSAMLDQRSVPEPFPGVQTPEPVSPVDLAIEPVPTFEEPAPMNLEPTAAAPMPTLSNEQPIAQTSYIPETVGETRLDPYAYEEGTYAWLRGVVRKDPEDGKWTITYDVTPEQFDEFAGHITLADDERLNNVSDNDVILVEGRVSSAQQDRFGKPLYEITELIRLNVAVR